MIIQITEADYQEHVESNDGLCIECGDWAFGGIEPDAEEYPCDSCGKFGVMGTEQALICGKFEFSEE